MDIGTLLKYIVIIFPLSEITLLVFTRSKEKSSSKRDRGSLQLLWLTIIASISLTVVLQWYPTPAFQLPRSIITAIALCFLTGGLIVRWLSILSLGKFFTVDVAIQEEHILVLRGLYKYARHPSYTGLLIEFLGLAVYFGNWVSLIIIMIPITGAIAYRIRCEEIALLEKFGKQYEEYMTHTKSLIPGIV
jgi:protein-S-isoprenylcysteine O-methyltransferase Ste14